MKCPKHIENYVRDAAFRFPGKSDEHHYYYQVVCSCGNRHFHVFKSGEPTVKLSCANCGRKISVYELAAYPAAVPSTKDKTLVAVVHPNGGSSLIVYVMYEYGEQDADEEFDPDGITWCQVFVENDGGDLVKILDDETV